MNEISSTSSTEQAGKDGIGSDEKLAEHFMQFSANKSSPKRDEHQRDEQQRKCHLLFLQTRHRTDVIGFDIARDLPQSFQPHLHDVTASTKQVFSLVH
jgi:hypothetical protein